MAYGNQTNKNSAQNQKLLINKISFSHPEKEKIFAFTTVDKNGYFRFSINKLSENVIKQLPEKNKTEDFIYTQFNQQEESAFTLNINISENPSFSYKYYTWLIHEHFKNNADVVLENFIYDNEFWFIENSLCTDKYNSYKKFTIRVDFEHTKNTPELVISFDGVSKVSVKSVEQCANEGISSELFSKVIYEKKLFKYKFLPEEAKYHYDEIFPIVNYRLHEPLEIDFDKPDLSNKCLKYKNNIDTFFTKYINTDDFKKVIPHSGTWQFIPENKIFRTSFGSNKLLFGKDKDVDVKEIIPHEGMKAGGPITRIMADHVKIFFIYHKADKNNLVELKKFINGQRGFLSFSRYLRFLPTFADSLNIEFVNKNNPLPEVLKTLENFSPAANTNYLAFYISPHTKFEKEYEIHSIYYRIKEQLLKCNISSQVIDSSKIDNDNFKYSMQHIAVAVCAKLGGIPWRLDCPVINELIVGVGAFKPITSDSRFIGSAFCFSNTGHFNGFEAYPADDIETLAGSIGTAVENFYKANNNPERLIIHFYKTMSDDEIKPIKKILRELDIDIPIIIISINKTESKDIVLFDMDYNDRMPLSGTYVPIGNNKYLLCNNTRYSEKPDKRPESFPFPIKLHIQSTDKTIFSKSEEIKKLIDQTYQFSRMYWKSTRQQNLPVTIKYPEMVAEIFPHFESETIPPFGQNNLWFL